jgi:integrase
LRFARERVIDADIEAKLLPFCKQPLRDVLMIMRDSGMRNQKEVFRMRWEHLDWGNKTIFRLREQITQGTKIRASQSTRSPGTSDAILGAEGGMDPQNAPAVGI